jgi:hypothetical protein
MSASLEHEVAGVRNRLSREIARVLHPRSEIVQELDLVFDRSQDDPPMAMARARRLLEVLVTDRLSRIGRLGPPHTKKNPTLHEMINKIAGVPPYSKEHAAICHAIRLAGNRAIHYHPGHPVRAEVRTPQLVECLKKVSEVAEVMTTGDNSIYVSSLPPRLAAMYKRLRGDLAPALGGKGGDFPPGDTLLLIFRSVSQQLKPEWLDYLALQVTDNTLPAKLTRDREDALRRLRNLGLLGHDGPWLFTPTRSKRADPTPRGRLFLRLDAGEDAGISEDLEDLVGQVIRSLSEIKRESHLLALLDRLDKFGHFTPEEERRVRELRNSNLVQHENYFLAGSNEVYLTDLGYYVLGRLTPD